MIIPIEDIDTLTENSRLEETDHAPLGVVSPQSVESVSENEEDSPTAVHITAILLLLMLKVLLQSGMSVSGNIKPRGRAVMSIFTDMFSFSVESLKFVC